MIIKIFHTFGALVENTKQEYKLKEKPAYQTFGTIKEWEQMQRLSGFFVSPKTSKSIPLKIYNKIKPVRIYTVIRLKETYEYAVWTEWVETGFKQ